MSTDGQENATFEAKKRQPKLNFRTLDMCRRASVVMSLLSSLRQHDILLAGICIHFLSLLCVYVYKEEPNHSVCTYYIYRNKVSAVRNDWNLRPTFYFEFPALFGLRAFHFHSTTLSPSEHVCQASQLVSRQPGPID